MNLKDTPKSDLINQKIALRKEISTLFSNATGHQKYPSGKYPNTTVSELDYYEELIQSINEINAELQRRAPQTAGYAPGMTTIKDTTGHHFIRNCVKLA